MNLKKKKKKKKKIDVTISSTIFKKFVKQYFNCYILYIILQLSFVLNRKIKYKKDFINSKNSKYLQTKYKIYLYKLQ